jgi:NTE family protein/lysophospholipid hydrolase
MHRRLIAWLDEQEALHRFTLYEAAASVSPWVERCLRQADLIVLVAQAGTDPRLSEMATVLLRGTDVSTAPRRSLVLLHPSGHQQPVGTAEWLAVWQVPIHHHLRWDTPADFERLARFVAGRAIGLVLSGGGVRGTAHIGAIRALKEAGIPIDFVGGTSMGALIAAAYAYGWDEETMLHSSRALVRALFDYTVPLVSLSTGRRFANTFKRLFGDTHIEDMWLPFFCVSANLTRADLMIHCSGLVWQAVRASGGLPGVLPPVVHNGDLLVDGAVLNNLPIDVMRRLCEGGTVIAVDVSPPVDLAENSPYGDSLSGWRVLWSKLNPFATRLKLPNLVMLLQRTGELGSIHSRKTQIRQGSADLYIRPPVEHFDLIDAKPMVQIAEHGYRAAKEAIAAWQRERH